MSQADVLLNSLSEDDISTYTSGSEVEPHIIINKDRTVTVPDELKRIAVQYDHNVETVTFDCPRYWDEHDLATMNIYVNYMRTDGYIGRFLATNVVVDSSDSDVIHFNWTISRNISVIVGTIKFLVCAKEVTLEGIETTHWNSELNSDMYVTEGLECDNTEIESDPDTVTQLLLRMDAVEDIVNAADVDHALMYYEDTKLYVNEELAAMTARLDEAMSGNYTINSEKNIEFSNGEYIAGSVAVNGTSAVMTVTKLNTSKVVGGQILCTFSGTNIKPLRNMAYHVGGSDGFILLKWIEDDNQIDVIWYGEPYTIDPDEDQPITLVYPLANSIIPEVNDIRAGADGAWYNSAGEAVRIQISRLNDQVEMLGNSDDLKCISGAGAPTGTTVGSLGLFYRDTQTGDLYKCSGYSGGEYVWLKMDAGEGVSFAVVNPVFVENISKCTDQSLVYCLPDGYLYAWMSVTVPGEPLYTNISDPSGYAVDQRMGSSGPTGSIAGAVVTNPIPVENGDVIRIKGINVEDYANDANAPKNGIYVNGASTPSSTSKANEDGDKWTYTMGLLSSDGTLTDTDGTAATYTIKGFSSNNVAIRFSGDLADGYTVNDVIITKNEEIVVGEPTTSYRWANTGHKFIQGSYEDRIIEVENDISDLKDAIDSIEVSDTDNISIPDYWKTSADAAIAKVKELQNNIGKDAVNFVWFSDLHYGDYTQKIKHFGKVCAYVMNELEIPFAVDCGDTMSSGVLSDEAALLANLDSAKELLSPIGDERLLLIRGNHDDVYGKTSSANYVNKVAPGTMWNKLHRFQANDFRRVFGGDGTYFYIDNVPQKTRFICLNSHFYEEGVTGGTSNAMAFNFGEEQMGWFSDTALRDGITDDWTIVIFTHVPPTSESINNHVYSELIGDYGTFDTIISSANNVVAVFSGHCHVDEEVIDSSTYMRVITITTAGGTPYGGLSASDRVAGTATEFAFDIVTIDKSDSSVRMTRVGFGEDRNIGV